MFKKFFDIDVFTKNIFIVFLGSTLASFFNLLFQLLMAHKLSSSEFAGFNSLVSIVTIIAAPLTTVQTAVAKYTAEFNASGQTKKIKYLLSSFFKKVFVFAVVVFLIFWFISGWLMELLKIPSVTSVYILSVLIASSCLAPIFMGGVQGLEFFGWLASAYIVSGTFKLVLGFVAVALGYSISGALGALFVSVLIIIAISYFPLRRFFAFRLRKEDVRYSEIFNYLLPVAISYFCFFGLVNFDMILVRYFFPSQESGFYSLAQIVGKVFLFLPGAVSIVMFPRTSRLSSKNMETVPTLKKSLRYAAWLCIFAALIYNAFPSLILKILTGKVYPESILLGRLFSISMSFFTLTLVLIFYFLSIKNLRFIKYLVVSTVLELFAIILFHGNIFQIQYILCINAVVLFSINLSLAFTKVTKLEILN